MGVNQERLFGWMLSVAQPLPQEPKEQPSKQLRPATPEPPKQTPMEANRTGLEIPQQISRGGATGLVIN